MKRVLQIGTGRSLSGFVEAFIDDAERARVAAGRSPGRREPQGYADSAWTMIMVDRIVTATAAISDRADGLDAVVERRLPQIIGQEGVIS